MSLTHIIKNSLRSHFNKKRFDSYRRSFMKSLDIVMEGSSKECRDMCQFIVTYINDTNVYDCVIKIAYIYCDNGIYEI